MEYHAKGNENFPASWEDPLELFGTLSLDLRSSGQDLDFERENVKDLIDMYGAQWVWDHRFQALRCSPQQDAKIP